MKWKRKENEKIKRLGDIMRKRKLGNEMKRKWKEKEIRKGEKREREKNVIFRNEWKKLRREKKNGLRKNTERKEEKKGGKEAGERGEVVNFFVFCFRK